jgi:Histone-like transcription factor (CBF/NF-Y) and archaeal histone
MQSNKDIGKISASAPMMIGKILEKFLLDLLTDVPKIAAKEKTDKVEVRHL